METDRVDVVVGYSSTLHSDYSDVARTLCIDQLILLDWLGLCEVY